MRQNQFASALCALAVAACALTVGPARAASSDVLDQPAALSARSGQAAMLALASAGPRLLAAGERGIIRYSDDGGQHWTQARTPVSVSLTAMQFATPQAGWAVGHGGVVLHTADGGQNWTRQLDGRQIGQMALAQAGAAAANLAAAQRLLQDGPDKPLLDVLALSPTRAVVVGAYGLALETRNGGRDWTLLTPRVGDARGRHLYAVAAIPGRGLLLAGEQGALFRSLDDGASFSALASPYEGSFFRIRANGDGWLLLGMRGHAYLGDAAGAGWQQSVIAAQASLTAAAVSGDGRMLLADEAGQLYGSADGGRHFAALEGVKAAAVADMRVLADGRIALAGMRGVTVLPAAPALGGKHEAQ